MSDGMQELEAAMSQAAKDFIRDRKAIVQDAISVFEKPKKKGKKKTSYHSHVPELKKMKENPLANFEGWTQYVIQVAKVIEAHKGEAVDVLVLKSRCGGGTLHINHALQVLVQKGDVLYTGRGRAGWKLYYWKVYAKEEIWDRYEQDRKPDEPSVAHNRNPPESDSHMVSLQPSRDAEIRRNPAKLQDLPTTPDSAVIKDIPPRPDETIYEGGGVKIFVKDNNIIVSCLQLTHSYCVSAAQLASCTIHFDEKYRDRFFAIACLLRDLYDDLDTYPRDILPKFSSGANLHGGQEFTFVRFSGETFPHDNGYQIESVKRVNLEGKAEDNFYQASLDYLVDLLKRKNLELSQEDCISTLGVQDLVKIDHCTCTKVKQIAAEFNTWENAQTVRLKAAKARGDRMFFLAIGYGFRRLFHSWFSRSWKTHHAPDCKWDKYQNDLKEIEETEQASKLEEARVLKVKKERYAEIYQKSQKFIAQRPVPVQPECFEEAAEAAPKKLVPTPTQALTNEQFNWSDVRLGPVGYGPNRKTQPSLGSRQNYQGQRFENLGYNNQDASRSNFQDCRFVNCSFEVCNFERAILNGCTFTNCTFRGCNLERATFQGSKLLTCTFIGCNLERANFAGCKASSQTTFEYCNVDRTVIAGSNIRF